jgi:hypothetical protein
LATVVAREKFEERKEGRNIAVEFVGGDDT